MGDHAQRLRACAGTGIHRRSIMSFFEQLRLLHPGWRDILEVAIVSLAIYRVLLVIHRTRAMQVLVGLIVLAVAYGLAYVLRLGMIVYLLTLIFSYGAIALLIVFAPELRAALAQIGRSPMSRLFVTLREGEIADEVSNAVERLSRSGIGAIIAIEREVSLEEYILSGSRMQAKVSADLLATIFTPYSPLHDGAVIIRGDNIVAAGCILPLSQAELADRSLGTRHRAALGLSEETDALVLVVSEETSTITIAHSSRLRRDMSPEQVREIVAGRSVRELSRDAEVGISS
jgi:diadenylate cyclase